MPHIARSATSLAAQGLVGDVLYVDVDGGDYVHAVFGVDVVAAVHHAREPGGYALAQHAAVAPFEYLAVDRLDAVIAPIAHQTQRAAPQLAIGIDALVDRHQIVGHAHVPVQDGVFAQAPATRCSRRGGA